MEGWGNLPEFLRMIFALLFVVALMGGFAYLLKRLGLNGAMAANEGKTKKRLKLIETLQLDARRRLVLVQRDDVQHLLIIGANEESVIETGITPPDNDDDVS